MKRLSIEDIDNTIDSVVIIGKNTVLRLNKREAKRLLKNTKRSSNKQS
jgi:hypothetical protein